MRIGGEINKLIILLHFLSWLIAQNNTDDINPSTELSVYYFSSITLDGQAISITDEITAYNAATDTLTGHAAYGNAGNGITEIIVYGQMDTDDFFSTEGYMLSGQVPQFYVNDIKANYTAEDGSSLHNIPAFQSPNIYTDLTLHLVSDCNGDMGGISVTSGHCGDCWGGNTGLEEDYMDTDNDGVCNAGSANGESDNCPNTANTEQANYDGDANGDVCDSDDDNDGALDANDTDDNNSLICHDYDSDGCDECANGSEVSTNNDGADYDGDGICDFGDYDDDNDGVIDPQDLNPYNPFICSDLDDDGCDDCSMGQLNPANDGLDFDGDGICDSGDIDHDNDGFPYNQDIDDYNPYVCSDTDDDGCEDCSSGIYDISNDGADYDGDGICDFGDYDDDNDGVIDFQDLDIYNSFICGDFDFDLCDDCSSGTFASLNDGADYDGDGICDFGDTDDDDDGSVDSNDWNDNNEFSCSDTDQDGCDDCSSGIFALLNDGADYDGDGWCNNGDPYPNCPYDNVNNPNAYPDNIDSNPYDECGNCHGDAFTNNCINTNTCADMDCSGTCNGNSLIDECDTCDNDYYNDCTDYNIRLDGVDLISFHGLIEDNSVDKIFDNLKGQTPTIMSENASAIYYNNMWLGSLSEINETNGYWVLINTIEEGTADCNRDCNEIHMQGSIPTALNTVYTLKENSNLISYPHHGSASINSAIPINVKYAIDAILSEGEAAINNNGEWVGGLTDFTGTKGYWFIANTAVSFSYNFSDDNMPRIKSSNRIIPEKYSYIQSTKQAFYFVEEAIIDGIEIDTDDLIIAYNKDVVVGSRYWYGGITDVPAMGLDNHYSSNFTGYCNKGDEIEFKILDASTDQLITMFVVTGNNIWSPLGISIVRLSNKENIHDDIQVKGAYPNPFNPNTTLKFSLPVEMNVEIMIYDMMGREITKLTNYIYKAGEHEVFWNGNDYSSGIYVAKMIIGGKIYNQKIMLIK